MNTLLTHRTKSALALLLPAVMLLGPSWPAAAQVQPASASTTSLPVTLTLDEAIQIALVNNYTMRSTRLDVDNARAQVREAWSEVLPQVDLSSSYTRNLKSANPFAGSAAGGLFSSFGFIDWLSYNEQARTDDDPSTGPITFDEFQDRRRQGLDQAGIVVSGNDNPFAVDNQFQSGITVSQTLFSGSAFAAIAGAERLKEINQRGVDRQEQVLIDQVRTAFYQALLTEEFVSVSQQSTARTQQTLQEYTRRVAEGVTPKFERLSAEVDLANLETQLVQARNQAASALDNLKLTLGIPVDQPVQLRGDLTAEGPGQLLDVAIEDAMTIAFEKRPDLAQAQLAVELRDIDRKIARSQYFPTISAFANFNYTGQVPDNRAVTLTDPSDPFSFSQIQNGFFSTSYWNPGINVGLRLSWNLFNGFRTSAVMQQRQIAVDRARIEEEQLVQSVRLEVEQALRDLEAARQRIQSQDRNVDRAELNYEYARARLREGVSSQLEERQASEQLDQSRYNYVQAMHDYLVARSAFETAVGMPLAKPSDFRFTSN